jgi:hypothetical protein
MYRLNYLYFIILTYFMIKFLLMKQVVVSSPLQKGQKLAFSGSEAFWVLAFATGLLSMYAEGIMDMSAIRMFSLEVIILLALFWIKDKPVFNAITFFYLLYVFG